MATENSSTKPATDQQSLEQQLRISAMAALWLGERGYRRTAEGARFRSYASAMLTKVQS